MSTIQPGSVWKSIFTKRQKGLVVLGLSSAALTTSWILSSNGNSIPLVRCDAPSNVASSSSSSSKSAPINSQNRQQEVEQGGRELSRSLMGVLGEQVSVGLGLGFATGFAVRKIGKILLGLVGTEIILLQYMSMKGWVNVNWNNIAADLSPNVRRSFFERLFDVLTHRIPFAASFSAGLYAGIKYSIA
mmetsp:Transcript_1414/g.2571  ORF Transcript_1414/g.2571 Transcript_1414/m.2571 type:complete len:188 (+) Transcript_1414:72-635(+)